MNVAKFGVRFEKLIIFAVAALAVLGVQAYTAIPAGMFPRMTFARIDVVANSGTLPPDQIRIAVSLPLERAFLGLPSTTRVLTTSAQGSSESIVEFDPKTDVQVDLQHVNDAINQVRSRLPPESTVTAVIVTPNSEPVVSYAFTSDTMSQTLLREMVEQSIVPQLYGIPGLARALVSGGTDREFHVTLDPAALAGHAVSAADVSKALADANTVSGLGIRQQYYRANVMLLDSNIKSIDSLRRVTVIDAQRNPIPLSELGSVDLGVAPLQNQVAYAGRHAVILNAYGLPGADAVKMAAAVKRDFDQLLPRLPVGVHAVRFWDQTDLVVESQKSLRDAILLGALLAILVIYAFLRNLRMTLVAAIIIPIAIAITIYVLRQFGQTLNLMSVGGLAVAVGLIIDDAIVVIENVARNFRLNPGLSKRDVLSLSMQQLASPMTASSLTTVVVFLPLALLTGVSGFFFRTLALTLGTALLVSLALALFVAPLLANWLIHRAAEAHDEAPFISTVLARYDPILQWALANRMKVYIGSGVVLVVTLLLMATLPSDFLPKLDEGQFEVSYRMPVGTTLAASDAAAGAMEHIVRTDPAVAEEGRLTGIDSNGYSPTPQSGGLIRIKLKPRSQRDSYDVVSGRLRRRIAAAVPASQLSFHQILEDMINDLSGVPAPVEVSIRGPEQGTLISSAARIASAIARVPGVTDTFDGVVYDDPTIRIAPIGSQLAALGLRNADVAEALSATNQGQVATTVAGAVRLVPVRVRVAGASSAPDNALISTSQGAIALGDIARVRRQPLSTDINEENGQREVRVQANNSGASLSSVIGAVREVLARTALPAGVTATIGGQYSAQQQSFREFATAIFIAVVLVFAVMLATFRSYRAPLVILAAIPLALIGVALGLFLTHTAFNVSSFMGLLLLVGIVVKNGILLVDVANRRREAGDDVMTALRAAGTTRLRPILMTTFAAIGGLLPLAIGLGSGAEMERPLAIAVIGGLSTATAFTLLVIPVLYAGFVGTRTEPQTR